MWRFIIVASIFYISKMATKLIYTNRWDQWLRQNTFAKISWKPTTTEFQVCCCDSAVVTVIPVMITIYRSRFIVYLTNLFALMTPICCLRMSSPLHTQSTCDIDYRKRKRGNGTKSRRIDWHLYHSTLPWASYQIRKIASCTCTENAGNVFPTTAG